jgi:hypothetical protein
MNTKTVPFMHSLFTYIIFTSHSHSYSHPFPYSLSNNTHQSTSPAHAKKKRGSLRKKSELILHKYYRYLHTFTFPSIPFTNHWIHFHSHPVRESHCQS